MNKISDNVEKNGTDTFNHQQHCVGEGGMADGLALFFTKI